MKSNVPHIALSECKDGYVYHLDCRNSAIGVFDDSTKGFIISRHKLGANYLFTEFHVDYSGFFKTAFPLKELGPCPVPKDSPELLEYLNNFPDKRELEKQSIKAKFQKLGCNLPDSYFEENPNWTY